MRNRTFAAAAAVLALAGSISAAGIAGSRTDNAAAHDAISAVVAPMPGAPGKADTSLVEAATYEIDPGHTLVTFTVDHMGFSSYTGQFGNPSGTLQLDPANPGAAKVDVTFPIADVSTTSAELTEHLQSADFFDAANHPVGRFVSTGVTVSGNGAKITGDLTLRGVTKPVTLDAVFYGAGSHPMNKRLNIGFRAETRIKRSDFGIDYGIPIVSDEVALAIDAAFMKPAE